MTKGGTEMDRLVALQAATFAFLGDKRQPKLMTRCSSGHRSGFGVLGFIISLGLILILIGVSLWAWNPLERIKQGRDAKRMADLDALKNAIDEVVSEENPLASTFGVPSSTVGVEVSNSPDGSGWIPLDLSSHLGELPNDPRNGRTFEDILESRILGEYQFVSDGKFYILRTHLEAEANVQRYVQDGNDNSWYEVGSAPGMSTYFGL